MTENIFKIVFFRGSEEDFAEDAIIMGRLPDPDLVAQVPEQIYDALYNTMYEMQAKQNRQAVGR